jgi:hypothetical protein
MTLIPKAFRRVSVETVLADQLFEADRLYAEHMASAEHHAALAGMYRGRAERIRKQQAQLAPLELRAVK